MSDEISRRHALSGAAGLGIGLPLLAACGGGDTGTASDPGSDTGSDTGSSDAGSGSDPSEGSGGGALAATSDIEVGGGTVFGEQKVVVTQPAEGEFRAFSSTCTHQGCQVGGVSDGLINCPCHGSNFSIEDGSPQSGPASAALPEVQITVKGGEITLA